MCYTQISDKVIDRFTERKRGVPENRDVLRIRSVSWIAHFGHETDMHPVDLIRDSSMLVRQKFKFNGVPDISLVKM
jgi:hypothetical protein